MRLAGCAGAGLEDLSRQRAPPRPKASARAKIRPPKVMPKATSTHLLADPQVGDRG